jgi:hypothetical protein
LILPLTGLKIVHSDFFTGWARIRGDKLVLGTISVLRTLVIELHRAGAIRQDSVLAVIDDTVTKHREHGDDAIGAIQISRSAAVSPRNDH